MKFENFYVWRGRLPHWRADGVTYYSTFKHRRGLDERERGELLSSFLNSNGKVWDLIVACVLPESTSLLFQVASSPLKTRPTEFSNIIERQKSKTAKRIMARTGELRPPFYQESFDRIVRDDAELEQRWNEIVQSPVAEELAETPEAYGGLWIDAATAQAMKPC